MKYFSDMGYDQSKDGSWHAQPHSINWSFFHDKTKPEYNFKSILFVTSKKNQLILGSPLCLILNSKEDINL